MPRQSSNPGRDPNNVPDPLPPARSRERRVQQLVFQAENLVEERIRNGTASPTEVVAIVRLGTEMERANVERIKMQTEYLQAQRDKTQSEALREELFSEAMAAMTRYQGRSSEHVTDI